MLTANELVRCSGVELAGSAEEYRIVRPSDKATLPVGQAHAAICAKLKSLWADAATKKADYSLKKAKKDEPFSIARLEGRWEMVGSHPLVRLQAALSEAHKLETKSGFKIRVSPDDDTVKFLTDFIYGLGGWAPAPAEAEKK